jgi:L-ascorbate metabolism protein UlaG (beta-lactamase superfamily)
MSRRRKNSEKFEQLTIKFHWLRNTESGLLFSLSFFRMSETAVSRRAFLAGLAATGALGWVYDSEVFSARVIRGAITDARREIARIAPPDFSGWSENSLDVLWAGHATALINLHGIHVLTDPTLFDWIGAQLGIATVGRRRLVSSALDPRKLPRIDLVLLSHAHMDHLDIASLRQLDPSVPVITAPKTSDILSGLGFQQVRELRWNEKARVQTAAGELLVQGVEVKHWGARWRSDSYRGYLGFLLERGGKRVLFGGDTAYTDAFRGLKTRQEIDLAIMPIGSYGSRSGHHCTPEEAVRMVDECRGRYVVPIHHSTFPIGREPVTEPLERLQNTLAADRIAIQTPGAIWRMPA